MKVVFFHRKPRPFSNFSVENLFRDVRSHLPIDVDWEVKEARYFSNGFLKRLYIGIDAAFSQKSVNHITGDINFIALFLKRKFTVLTIHDLGLLNNTTKFKRWLLKIFWVQLPVKYATIVTTVSHSTKDELLKHVSVNPNKITVVYVPIADQFVSFPKVFNKKCPIILQIGTKSNKNLFRLVQALRGITCKLDIVGEITPELHAELSNNGILFTHSQNLSNQEILEKYKLADIVSFVSTYEGFGMPIVEANAVGRVVVTSNILSMPEVAGGAGHLVDPFDVNSIRYGIVKVIEDDDYREKLILKGFDNAGRFKVEGIVNQYVDLYKQLLGLK